MIVDYIERSAESDFDNWRQMGKAGNKHHQVEAWAPVKTGSTVAMKCIVPLQNSKLDDIV